MDHTLAVVLYVLAAVALVLSYIVTNKPTVAGYQLPLVGTALAILLFVISYHFYKI